MKHLNSMQPTSSTARLIAKRKAVQEEKAAAAAAAASSPFASSDFRPSIRQVKNVKNDRFLPAKQLVSGFR